MSKKNLYSKVESTLFKENRKEYNDLLEEILIVIVLYNTHLIDSHTFQTLKNSLKTFSTDIQVDLMICDNSLLPQVDIDNVDEYDDFNFYYLHDSNNPGISLSYNRAIDLASAKQKKWILVFDQDTELPIDAIEKYVRDLKKQPGFAIYAPKVYFNNILLSPCRYFMYRGSPYKNFKSGVHTLQGKNVINSGLLISVNAYIEVGGYDEKVWLYYSDFVFFNKLKKNHDKFVVLDLNLHHNLQSSDYGNISFALNRFTHYCQGARAASNSYGNLSAYIGHGITVGLRSVLMCKRFGSAKFLKVFYKNYIVN